MSSSACAAGRLQQFSRRDTVAGLASWNISLLQRQVALDSGSMNEFSDF
jgi:hypothetical protein